LTSISLPKIKRQTSILVLGTAQDGGVPQTGCILKCCQDLKENKRLQRLVSSLAIIKDQKCWIVDITPDFRLQLDKINEFTGKNIDISGIFITHAHLGHYIGLLQLGLEVMNTNSIPTYVMPKMKIFLENNAPFSQLIKLNNIKLIEIKNNNQINLTNEINIIPFEVPHRNEFSETVGYKIKNQNKSLIYIPDIDSWEKWESDIISIIYENDYLLLDGTFYSNSELSNRNIADVPHPLIKETIKKISKLNYEEKSKIYFTHINHTNPILDKRSKEFLDFTKSGCKIAEDYMFFNL